MQCVELPQRIFKFKHKELDLSVPHVMGILNVTPDSFSDGGQYHDLNAAVIHAKNMIAEGATIIDIGGESTRPHADKVSIEEEIRRVIPVVEALSDLDIILSIDTSQPQVIRAAVQAGAHIWNDVRALQRPDALTTAAELAIPVIFMHMRGEPDTMNDLAIYHNVVQEVKQELQQKVDQAIAVGISPHNIILDPGFGFAKNTIQNLQLLNQFWQLSDMGYPVLSALSRKRFIGEVLNGVEANARDIASATAHLLSIQQGASIVRTHNVKIMAENIKMWQAMCEQ